MRGVWTNPIKFHRRRGRNVDIGKMSPLASNLLHLEPKQNQNVELEVNGLTI